MKSYLKKIAHLGILTVVLSLGLSAGCSRHLSTRSVPVWSDSDEAFIYEIRTRSPKGVFAEGYDVVLVVKEKKSDELFFYVRLLSGLDTGGVPGFVSAKVQRTGGWETTTVVITVKEHDGLKIINIPVRFGYPDWKRYLEHQAP